MRTTFAQPNHASAVVRLRRVVEGLRPRFPEPAARLEEATEDVLSPPAGTAMYDDVRMLGLLHELTAGFRRQLEEVGIEFELPQEPERILRRC